MFNEENIFIMSEEDPQDPPSDDKKEAPQNDIKNMGSITTKNSRGTIHCITIIGQIEGHYLLPQSNKTTKYEHIIPQLVAVEESPEVEGLLILLNTVGGDVEAGLAISELISTMKKPTVSIVLGGGHSIGVPLAVASRRSFIVPSATMTIHPVRMTGLVIGIPSTFSYLQKMQDRIVRFVEDNSHIKAQRFKELMFKTGDLASDVGTVLSGEEAVAEGLIDQLGGLSDAMEALYEMIESRKAGEVQGDPRQGDTKQAVPPEEQTRKTEEPVV